MTEFFSDLSENEYKQLTNAVSEITILIAGADGKIENSELEWAEKVTKIRSYKMSEELLGFYQEVGITFHSDLEALIKELPVHTGDRQNILETRIEKLNPILAKLNPIVAGKLHESFTSFAKHVAKASGGLFGFFAIGPKEGDLIELPMLDKILYEEEEE
jgi:hypothetical protein